MTYPVRLHQEAAAILNQLFHLDAPRLLLQGAGVSLLRQTEFGIFFHQEDGWVLDPVSGIVLDPSQVRAIYALPGERGEVPRLAFEFPRQTLSILPSQQQEAFQRVCEAFSASGMPAEETSRIPPLWLDEWGTACSAAAPQDLRRRAGRTDWYALLSEASEIELSLEGQGVRSEVRFCPGMIDREASILKVADPSQQHVLYLDEVQFRGDLRRKGMGTAQVSCLG
ncbi:MAG: hypothetical protein AAF191_18005 [Verrucomicrobiota bacterium]